MKISTPKIGEESFSKPLSSFNIKNNENMKNNRLIDLFCNELQSQFFCLNFFIDAQLLMQEKVTFQKNRAPVANCCKKQIKKLTKNPKGYYQSAAKTTNQTKNQSLACIKPEILEYLALTN
jgi:hypothetical protein